MAHLPQPSAIPGPTPRTLIGPRPAGWLLFPTAVTALLVTVYVLIRLYDTLIAPVPTETMTLFHITTEGGVVTWWNSTLLLGIAALALLLAALSGPGRPAPGRIGRASWLVVAAGAGYLSLDESVALHERLGGPADRLLGGETVTLFTFAWVFPGAVLALTGCAVTVRWARRLPFDLRLGVCSALAVYVTGALGVEALNGWLKRQHADLAVQLGTLVEETLEMAGCLVALATFAAALVLVRDQAGRVTLALRPDLSDPRTPGRVGSRPYGAGAARSGPGGSSSPASPVAPAPANAVSAPRTAYVPQDPADAMLRPDPRDEMR